MMRFLLPLLAGLLLGGCWQSQTRTAYRATGQLGGQAVDLSVSGAGSSDAGIDASAAVQGALAALRGDLAGLSKAVASQPPPVPAAELAAAIRPELAAAKPATVTGSSTADTALAALLAYLTGKGGLAIARRVRPPKANP